MRDWVSYCFLAAFAVSGVLSINYETGETQVDKTYLNTKL